MRGAVVPSGGWLTRRWQRALIIGSMLIRLVLMMLIAVPSVYADSPCNDGTQPRPQGGGTGSITTADLPALPPHFAELPSPLLAAPSAASNASVALIPQQQAGPETNPNTPLAGIGLGLNPGKWLLDSVLGATTGISYSLASVFAVLGRFGSGQVVDLNGSITTISDNAFGFLFTTPESLTIAWAGANGLGSPQALPNIMRQAARSILVVIGTYRALFGLTSSAFRDGLVDLLSAFRGGLLGIQGAWWFCTLFVRTANLITAQRLSVALGGGLGTWLPLDPQTSFWSSLSSIQGVSLAIALAPCGATAGAEPP